MYTEATKWREEASYTLRDMGHESFSPMRGKEGLKNAGLLDAWKDVEALALSDGLAVNISTAAIYAQDMFDIQRADLLLVNLLYTIDVSIGTVMEMQSAHDLGTYVLTVMDDGNIHDHPFVHGASTIVVKTLPQAMAIIAMLGEPHEG